MIMTTAACEAGSAVAQDKRSADGSQFLREILQRKIQDGLDERDIFIAGPVVRSDHSSDDKSKCFDGGEVVVASWEKGVNTDGPKRCPEEAAAAVADGMYRSCTDSQEVSKKRRIEGIVSSMCGTSYSAVGGCKKRKHYQPVQHETSRQIREEKKHSADEEDFKCQLKMMEEKLLEMKHKYDQICSHDNVRSAQNKDDAVHADKGKFAPSDRRQNGVKSALHSQLSHNGASVVTDSHFLNAASRVIAGRKDFVQRRAGSERLNCFGRDFEDMAEALKADMINSLASMIDSILDRYLRLLKNGSSSPPKKESSAKDARTIGSYENFVGSRSSCENHVEFNSFGSLKAKSPPLSPKSYSARSSYEPWDSYDVESNHEGTGPDAESDSEQCEALSLVMTPKKRRTKVTDSRVVQRMGRPETDLCRPNECSYHRGRFASNYPLHPEGRPNYIAASSLLSSHLSTGLAVANSNLSHSNAFARYSVYGGSRYDEPLHGSREDFNSVPAFHRSVVSTRNSPDGIQSVVKSDVEQESLESHCENAGQMSMTLTPMHLRKAKLMFFWVRYPSSSVLKTYFPDVKFNKNNTAQLVKWFSNFREFYYIQIEKFARQAVSENLDNIDDLKISLDSELFRVLNLHYNRNNHIEVPIHFCPVMEQTVKEFYNAIVTGKDQEPSWKKSIYKVIARLDETVPEYFKSPSFLEQLE